VFAGATALVASTANADAGAREIDNAWSYGFADSLLLHNGVERSTIPSVVHGALRCFVDCGPSFGASVVRRSELLSSNTGDVSARRVVDASGHLMGVSGTIVIERLERNGFGADWVVVGERTLDEDGTHSWALLSTDVSREPPWVPINLYQFEGSSVSTDFAAGARLGATPEASTWTMMLIGFAGLGFAGYRGSRNQPFSILIRNGAPFSCVAEH
jgi:hypothetical protein